MASTMRRRNAAAPVERRNYKVIADVQLFRGNMMGPHRVNIQGDSKTVLLSQSEARWYLDHGMIEPA